MGLEGTCRIIIQNGSRPRKVLVYIPLEIARDSQFPFRKTATAHIKVTAEGKIEIQKSEAK